MDFERRVVSKRGEPLKLTPAEYNLLSHFLQNPDRPLTRDMILKSVWGYESFPNTRTVDAHVVRLRQKLEADPNAPRHFLTVHGVGYRFALGVTRSSLLRVAYRASGSPLKIFELFHGLWLERPEDDL